MITVQFTPEEHAALLRFLRDMGADRIAEKGAVLDSFDLRGAVLAMERATRAPLRSA